MGHARPQRSRAVEASHLPGGHGSGPISTSGRGRRVCRRRASLFLSPAVSSTFCDRFPCRIGFRKVGELQVPGGATEATTAFRTCHRRPSALVGVGFDIVSTAAPAKRSPSWDSGPRGTTSRRSKSRRPANLSIATDCRANGHRERPGPDIETRSAPRPVDSSSIVVGAALVGGGLSALPVSSTRAYGDDPTRWGRREFSPAARNPTGTRPARNRDS